MTDKPLDHLVSQDHSTAITAKLRSMADAPRDGTPVLTKMRGDIYPGVRPGRDDLEPWNGRWVVMHHRGNSPDGWDPGWAVSAPVGHGGFPDDWFEGWTPLPLSSATQVDVAKSRDTQND